MSTVSTSYVYHFFYHPDDWIQMPNTGQKRAIFNGNCTKGVLILVFHDQFQILAYSMQIC